MNVSERDDSRRTSCLYRSTLKWLLILIGIILMSAAAPMCFPFSTMAWIHRSLGLGELPETPITIYLARTTSLLYSIHGVTLFVVGVRLDRYLPLATLLGWVHVAVGIVMLTIDLTTPMPWWWTALEGIPISIGGGVIVWLASRTQRASDAPA